MSITRRGLFSALFAAPLLLAFKGKRQPAGDPVGQMLDGFAECGRPIPWINVPGLSGPELQEFQEQIEKMYPHYVITVSPETTRR